MKVKDRCLLVVDCPHSTPVWTDSGVLVFRSPNIRNGRLDLSQKSFTNEDDYAKRVRRAVPSPGDIIITREAPMGEVAIIPEGVRGCLGQRMVLLRPDPSTTDARFLLYALMSPMVQEEIKTHEGTGSTVSNLRIPSLEALEIPSPALSEQRAIAHILGTLDDKIELNRRMNETLEAMARALFKSWFVDFDPVRLRQGSGGQVRAKAEGRPSTSSGQATPGLPQPLADLFPDSFEDSELGEIPRGWKVAPLPEVMDVNPTRALRKGVKAPYLDMANMPTHGHSPDKMVDRAFGSGMRFVNGDTLVARITPCLENGKTAFVDFLEAGQVGWGSTEYIVFRPKPPLPDEFAYCLARGTEFREFAIQSMTGSSGRQRVPADSLSHFRLVAAPSPIAELFGRLIKPLFARASAATREGRTLAALRDTLLPKLISGELRVAHPITLAEGTQ